MAGRYLTMKNNYPEAYKTLIARTKKEDDDWATETAQIYGTEKEAAPADEAPAKVVNQETVKVEKKLDSLMHKGVAKRRTPCGSFFST